MAIYGALQRGGEDGPVPKGCPMMVWQEVPGKALSVLSQVLVHASALSGNVSF